MMTPPINPPKRRNAQIRTYATLLQCAVKRNEVTDIEEARDVLRQLNSANARIGRATRDALAGIDTHSLVSAAHRVLGFEPESLLHSQGDLR